MTIPVPLYRLPEAMACFNSASLITLPYGAHVKVHTVDPILEDGRLVIRNARDSALRNGSANPNVTLIWQSPYPHGWSLVVDGQAWANGPNLMIEYESGILHRPRYHNDGPQWVWQDGERPPQ